MKTITYITRDIERALGMEPSANYRIVTNKCPYAETIKQKFPEFVTLIEAPAGSLVKTLGTGDLIEKSPIPTDSSDLIVFKNTPRLEPVAITKGWKLLNPRAALAETIENKISQIEWLGELGKKYLPSHNIVVGKALAWTKEPFIIQWAHGHTGTGTILIESEEQLRTIKSKFPERITRRTAFVRGPSFTVNVVVASDKILIGNISYQITGLEPFTDNMFATIGNDWGLTHSLLNAGEIETIQEMAYNIGKKMNIAGWRGLFGIDVIRDDDKNTINLIEINARQPASTTFESVLQLENRKHGVKGLTTFEAHIKALCGESINEDLIEINDGAQILQRITRKVQTLGQEKIEELKKFGYDTLLYSNTQHNEDLVRIQSNFGIMETHGRFNKRGRQITNALSGTPQEVDEPVALDDLSAL